MPPRPAGRRNAMAHAKSMPATACRTPSSRTPGSIPRMRRKSLRSRKHFALVRGIRSKPVTSRRPGESVAGADGSMQDPKWLAGLRLLRKFDLSWDLRVPTWHLEEAAQVVRANPDIPVVLNHTGFPWDRSDAGLDAVAARHEGAGRLRAGLLQAFLPVPAGRAPGTTRTTAGSCWRRSRSSASIAACSPRTSRWTACAFPMTGCSRTSSA